jgi:hypothetical protein
MKMGKLNISFACITLLLFLNVSFGQSIEVSGSHLPGFSASPFFNEQILTFDFAPEVRIQINAPSIKTFDPSKPTELIFFALPNGNTIEETVGRLLKPGDDWHYDIQHIGAQTRFLREHDPNNNIVTIYLETSQLSWPSWRSKYSNNASLVKSIVDSVKNIFKNYNPFIVLSGHSGGGGFTFSYMNSVSNIPNDIKRISFLDSDYNYDDTYGNKILNWINASPDHYLCVIAYNDSVALYNGQPIVSPTGGTWYRSKLMEKYLSNYFSFTSESDSVFIKYTALNGRIKFILKQNPTRAILHTVQVELNGFIQGIFSGTTNEGIDYVYYGSRAYSQWIQPDITLPKSIIIPARPSNSITGSQFMNNVKSLTFQDREDSIYSEISKGNIPDFLRNQIMVCDTVKDASGVTHIIYYEVLPDYLAIGSNDDYCRVPIGPITAQKLALLFGANLPTSKLVDNIHKNSTLRLFPVFYPWSDTSTMVIRFVQHSHAVDSERVAANGILGELTDGAQKDVVLSNLITDPTRPNHVVIYGWYYPQGDSFIQPLTNIHNNGYADYSHGIRLINNEVLVDSVIMTVPQILKDPVLYKILSNENGPMTQPSYLTDSSIPVKPKSFGIKSMGSNELQIIIKPDTMVKKYDVYLSNNGVNFSNPLILSPADLTIKNLKTDSLYFIKLKAENTAGESPETEVLAGIPTSSSNLSTLIVNGFDRASAGNTYNFIRQHGNAFFKNGISFESATNDAVIDGLFSLENYKTVDYILGDESTADETFSNSEQAIVRDYLDSGGKLFVSGSEIAWDLDYKGSVSDKSFIWNFLKMKYIADAPNSQSGVYYSAGPIDNSFVSGMPQFFFDNGTHGTINVLWPDLVKAINGAKSFMKFANVDTSSGVCGVYYEGLFPNGSQPGKVVCLTFPFEAIYPDSIRTELMSKILTYLNQKTNVQNPLQSVIPKSFKLYQNFPNPFNPTTTIKFSIPKISFVSLKIYSILGQEIATLINIQEKPGEYNINYSPENLASGVYIYTLTAGSFVQSKKLVLLK